MTISLPNAVVNYLQHGFFTNISVRASWCSELSKLSPESPLQKGAVNWGLFQKPRPMAWLPWSTVNNCTTSELAPYSEVRFSCFLFGLRRRLRVLSDAGHKGLNPLLLLQVFVVEVVWPVNERKSYRPTLHFSPSPRPASGRFPPIRFSPRSSWAFSITLADKKKLFPQTI